jgi:hypothetical protein
VGHEARVRAILTAVVLLRRRAWRSSALSFSVAAPDLAASDPVYVSTVALAADQVVWVKQRGAAAILVAASPDGAPRDVRSYGVWQDGGLLVHQDTTWTAVLLRFLADGRRQRPHPLIERRACRSRRSPPNSTRCCASRTRPRSPR